MSDTPTPSKPAEVPTKPPRSKIPARYAIDKLPTPPPDPRVLLAAPESPREKLPTPPPDPRVLLTAPKTTPESPKRPKTPQNTQETDREVFEYIESLHRRVQGQCSRSEGSCTPAIATEEAFDHLEKLYKMMEQMLDLREQNAKLHRRIRDLEHINNLDKLQKQFQSTSSAFFDDPDNLELDRDTEFAETILESILQDTASTSKSKDPQFQQLQKQKSIAGTMLKPSILRNRNRSGSATDKQVTLEPGEDPSENIEGIIVRKKGDIKSAKISKWTKVKAAFRWEKASNSVNENQISPSTSKSQDSGIHVPVNVEIARYLRVPSTSDDAGHSPVDSGAGISTPGSLSTASSNEDFRNTGDIRTPIDGSDDDQSHLGYIPAFKEKHHKGIKTPWAKMKDIIHTRNSFKKKHRLSAASDDIQIDVEFCSDNEDNVFLDDDIKSRATQISSSPSPNPRSWSYSPKFSSEIRPDIIHRYQKALAEDNSLENDRVSRWSRVRKAFLSQETEDDTTEKAPMSAEEEIQQSYRKLQKKLSLEFQEKLNEWERLKQNSPSTSTTPATCSILDDNKDPFFIKRMEEWQKIKGHSPTMIHNKDIRGIPMTRQYELPPDFKKKMQEWERIKKSNTTKKKLADVPRWKSLSGHRSETSTSPQTFEYPELSDDFRKKLEEWKQIKASGGCTPSSLCVDYKKSKDKTPSPKLSRKNSSPKQHKKHKEKESQWFEKELCKIEKEKQRLERDRNKFLEREERLSKLRRSMMGGTKKEVLIHTPSGFHRFEGISRKFTQKLYEWEKAQGIRPEESTFALLSASSFTPDMQGVPKRHTSYTPPLMRSKSADSIAMSALNLTHPLMSPQPSSLSLNDVDELEKTCMADSSKCSSMQFLTESQNELNLDEPEAVLVEVEDYEEETAEPLFQMFQKHELPVYQRQENKTLCEGETVAAPKIERSESTRAQSNYNLIENIGSLLTTISESQTEIKKILEHERDFDKLQEVFEFQKSTIKKVIESLVKLQEANTSVASKITQEESKNPSKSNNLSDMMDCVQDLSSELIQLAEELDKNLIDSNDTELKYHNDTIIYEIINEIRCRLIELRRHLSYLCAASDLTSPICRKSTNTKIPVHKTLSNDSKDSRCDTSDTSRKNSQKEKRYVKSETATNINASQGAVRKRIRYRQQSMHQKSICLPDTDDDDEPYDSETLSTGSGAKKTHKKVTRQRSISENSALNVKKGTEDPTNIFTLPVDSPVGVFVKTTRKLFTPIAESSLAKSITDVQKPTSETECISNEPSTTQELPTIQKDLLENITSTLPPLPSSPIPQRKVYKDVSPSIRLMMAKYNQKVGEQELGGQISGGSSGSSSPIWRSPISERRVRAQTEKYQVELSKLSPLLGQRKEVQKSASASYVNFGTKQITIPVRKTSLNTQSESKTTVNQEPKKNLTLDISLAQKNQDANVESKNTNVAVEKQSQNKHSPEIRQKKLQKAKEDFLKAGPHSAPTPAASDASCEDALTFPQRNRLSQISVGSETSYESGSTFCGTLVKSVSAGMINIDADSYRQIDPEFHGDGYVSLPRCQTKPKDRNIHSNKFGFSSIAAKFRKVKMRKGKNNKMDTVATLCRQSLVVDINDPNNSPNNQENLQSNNSNGDINRQNNSNESSNNPVTKSHSWIMRSLFKK